MATVIGSSPLAAPSNAREKSSMSSSKSAAVAAATRSPFVGKCLKSAPWETPARRTTSVVVVRE